MYGAMKTVRILRVASWFLCLGVMFLLRLPAAGQGQALPVNVSFEFAAPEIVNSFDDAATRTRWEGRIAEQLVKKLQSRFPYWKFESAGSAGNVTLKAGLRETDSLTLWLKLLSAMGQERQSWQAEIFPPGELIRRGMPTGGEWLDTVPSAFDEKLLDLKNEDIFGALKSSAPVGKEAVMLPVADSTIAPRAVLPLDWGKYSDLAGCEFRLHYTWNPGHGMVTLYSTGIGIPGPFTPDKPQFDGVTVQLEYWQQGSNKVPIDQMRGHLGELAPVDFYLEAVKPPGSE